MNPPLISDSVLTLQNLDVSVGNQSILKDISFEIKRGTVVGCIGASGSGKSVLMRTILGLIPHQKGSISLFGETIDETSFRTNSALEKRCGVLFQHGALFSSLTTLENIQIPMREHGHFSQKLMDELAFLKLSMVGLPASAASQMPSSLSGGMIKRVALARALSMDPELLFLDEPTAGLDPLGATAFDKLVITLQRTLNLTLFMITHDIDTLSSICDIIIALGKGRILAIGPLEDMLRSNDPWLKAYFKERRMSFFEEGSYY
jgi:phospholipid/cholesterol/gamma-HCH transport system ATP-binding protein